MRTTNPRSKYTEPFGVGPQLGFFAATFAGLAAGTGLFVPVPAHLTMPVIATTLLAFAACIAVFAPRHRDESRVTYEDVAGALTLIGLCAAATIDPEQLTRIVAGEFVTTITATPRSCADITERNTTGIQQSYAEHQTGPLWQPQRCDVGLEDPKECPHEPAAKS